MEMTILLVLYIYDFHKLLLNRPDPELASPDVL